MIESNMHVSRSWTGHQIEDLCPCPKMACGLVQVDPDITCDQHNPDNSVAAKTLRQLHWPKDCPAAA